MSAPVSRNAGRGMRIEEWAYVRSGIHVAKPSVFVSYRQRGRVPGVLFLAYVVTLIAVSVVCPGLDAAVNHSPLGYVLIWVPFAICVAALLVMAFRYVSLVGSAERLLDVSCDPAALAARGDELGLADPVPKRGYTRIEAVLVQRWAVALVEVGRAADAAAARRRLEESLARRRRTGRSPYGASLRMLLADVSARLGDGEAAWPLALAWAAAGAAASVAIMPTSRGRTSRTPASSESAPAARSPPPPARRAARRAGRRRTGGRPRTRDVADALGF